MDKFDRIYELDRLMRGRRTPVPLQRIMAELECSPATAKRAIRHLREQLGAPIRFDREREGYVYDGEREARFELPGLWFNPDELYALLASYQLLDAIRAGALGDYVRPLRDRLQRMLRNRRAGHPEIEQRVRILPSASRPLPAAPFRQVAAAVLERKRLHVRYRARSQDAPTERTVSPQRLVHYRSNWYLDGWCHLRDGLRSFSVDRLEVLDVDDAPALDLPDDELDAFFATAYGIFGGAPTATAVLRFSPYAARWVADEQWHPEQTHTWLDDGRYELRVPYGDPTELIMDVLKWGPEVEVVGPDGLRAKVGERLQEALAAYRTDGDRGITE